MRNNTLNKKFKGIKLMPVITSTLRLMQKVKASTGYLHNEF